MPGRGVSDYFLPVNQSTITMHRILLFLLFLLPAGLFAQNDFVHAPESPHYLVVMPKPGWADMSDMVGGFAKHHASYFLNREFFVRQYKMTKADKMPFVLVGEFTNETDAALYYQKLQEPLVPFLQMGTAIDYFIISAENYNECLARKKFTEYRTYFHKTYPD